MFWETCWGDAAPFKIHTSNTWSHVICHNPTILSTTVQDRKWCFIVLHRDTQTWSVGSGWLGALPSYLHSNVSYCQVQPALPTAALPCPQHEPLCGRDSLLLVLLHSSPLLGCEAMQSFSFSISDGSGSTAMVWLHAGLTGWNAELWINYFQSRGEDIANRLGKGVTGMKPPDL